MECCLGQPILRAYLEVWQKLEKNSLAHAGEDTKSN